MNGKRNLWSYDAANYLFSSIVALASDINLRHQYRKFVTRFLRATAYMLSAHMLSQFRLSVRLSVRPSVTRVIHAKTVAARIVQFSPYSSHIPLVFAR